MPGSSVGAQRPGEPQASEVCFRELVERNADGVLVIDQDGFVRFVNAAAASLFGHRAEDLIGREFGFPVAVGETTELAIPGSDGVTVAAEMRVTEIAWNGEIGYLASLRDITERKRQEESLHLQALQLETASKITSLLRRSQSFAGKCADVLEELRRIVPVDLVTFRVPEEKQLRLVAAAGPHANLPPSSLISLLSISGSAFQKGEPVVANDYPSDPQAEGPVLELGIKSVASLPIKEDGRTLGVINFLSHQTNYFTPARIRVMTAIGDGLAAQLDNARLYDEITSELKQRQRAEEALGASEARFRQLYDEAPVGYQEVDVAGHIIRVNRTELEMLGYTSDEMLGRPVWEFMVDPERARKSFTYKIEEMISPGGAYERTFVLKNGSTLPALIEDRPIRNAAGRIIGLRSTIQDITERKRAEERLQETGRLVSIGELAAGVAHEINNPLTIVAGFAEVLMAKQLEQPAGDYVQRIYSESQRAAKIVKNLLSFARKYEPQKQYMCVTDVLTEALELKAHDLMVNNIQITRSWPVELPLTMIDKHQLLQVFLNVLTRACSALVKSQGGGEIILGVTATEDTINIGIADNGPGIATEHLHKIFDPFFTTKSLGEGTGLGLSICYGIVGQHGGDMWAESRAGEGTTFYIELPILYCQADPDLWEEPAEARPRHEQHILVVDDEPAIRDLLYEVLTQDGHTVDLPGSSPDAKEMIQNHQYDCIIMDLRMPKISGQQLYKIVADTDPDLARKIIFITGDTARRETRDFLEATGNPVLSKPFNARDLLHQIQRLWEALEVKELPKRSAQRGCKRSAGSSKRKSRASGNTKRIGAQLQGSGS